jgi:2-oxoglutarate ferredoxin oxidoreductase subunit gamma
MSRTEVYIAGFGGQGIILAGYILGKAASLYDRRHATLTQSYGPESRGGACSAKLIIDDQPIHYPHLIAPHLLVAMSQEAYERYIGEMSEEGLVLIDETLVDPEHVDHRAATLGIPATLMAEDLGRKIMANIVMLGFVVATTGLVSAAAVREAVRTSVPPGTEEINLGAFERGYAYGQNTKVAAAEVSRAQES